MEVDLYSGYRFPVSKAMAADVGVLRYTYPGALLNSAPATPTNRKYDTTEIYTDRELSYSDCKVALGKEFAGLNLAVAVVGSSANANFFQITNSVGLNSQSVGKAVVVLSVSKSF
jgi:hypothetical protein